MAHSTRSLKPKAKNYFEWGRGSEGDQDSICGSDRRLFELKPHRGSTANQLYLDLKPPSSMDARLRRVNKEILGTLY